MDEQTAKALQEIHGAETNKKEEASVEQKQQQINRQPQPEIMNYEETYSLSDLFIEHLKLSLRHIPHYKAYQYVNYAEQHKNGLSIVDLNGFIKKLDMLEYGYINGLMTNIKSKEGQSAYFLPVKSNTTTNAK